MTDAPPLPRSTYRHGDLRRALLEAGLQLARTGGPDAVTLREATRRAGVVPNAAYRHFANREDLLRAVRAAALSALAVAMESDLAALSPEQPPAAYAKASLRIIGVAYLRFARSEPGLFRTAFAGPMQAPTSDPAEQAGNSGLDPFQLLGVALDRMAAAGLLSADGRLAAEYLAWSAVHGLAMLVLDGPLQSMPPDRVDALIPRLLAMVENGL
jgi:AcrR family transcriptional regulator